MVEATTCKDPDRRARVAQTVVANRGQSCSALHYAVLLRNIRKKTYMVYNFHQGFRVRNAVRSLDPYRDTIAREARHLHSKAWIASPLIQTLWREFCLGEELAKRQIGQVPIPIRRVPLSR